MKKMMLSVLAAMCMLGFTACGNTGSSIGRSGSNLASQAGSGNWLEGGRLDVSISDSEIQDWINDMN